MADEKLSIQDIIELYSQQQAIESVSPRANDFSRIDIKPYRYQMGFEVDGTPIPDPSEFSGADSALDASGERDANGYLHRDMVATKHPLKIGWNALDWGMINFILPLVKDESFQFRYPDPSIGTWQTIKAYAGDRAWDVKRILEDGTYVGSLSFSVIEF